MPLATWIVLALTGRMTLPWYWPDWPLASTTSTYGAGPPALAGIPGSVRLIWP